VLNGTFTLTVSANAVSGSASGNGDEVNKFGNGFDSFRQHDYAGALIVGWPATQSDRGTRFILGNGTHAGAYRFEYAPSGSASGLCVSDPGGGSKADPLRDGLILAHCNSSAFQQFIPQSNGTLKNLGTGLYVNPDGKGAQLRGERSGKVSGGSSYSWTAEGNLSNRSALKPLALGLPRLPYLSLSRHVSCTNPCTNRVTRIRGLTRPHTHSILGVGHQVGGLLTPGCRRANISRSGISPGRMPFQVASSIR